MDRGASKRICFYSFVELKDGGEEFMVMSAAEVEKIRKRSKRPDEGPWATDYDEMGKKTAFRRHSKWLPLSSEVRDAVEHDDDAIDLTGWDEADQPARPAAKAQDKKSLLDMAREAEPAVEVVVEEPKP